MNGFAWHRKPISFDEYQKEMDLQAKTTKQEFEVNISDDGKKITIPQETIDALYGSKHLSAYNVASDIRKFEIELFWKRAGFFWAFITVTYAAYFNVLTKIYFKCESEHPPYLHGTFPLLVLAALGLFFCFSWLLANYGSRHWQENWENHLDLLEDSVTGPLYKTYKAKSYSVSKIAIAAGWVVTVCGYGLVLYEFASFAKNKFDKGIHSFILTLAFAIAVSFALFAYSHLMLGNLSDSGEVEFQRKKYEEEKS